MADVGGERPTSRWSARRPAGSSRSASSTPPKDSSTDWWRDGVTFTTASDAHRLERVGERADDLADLLEARGVHELATYNGAPASDDPAAGQLVATLAELAALRTSLSDAASTTCCASRRRGRLLADLSFSDMLLMARVDETATRVTTSFVVLGQMRPNNRSTLINDDLVGTTQRRRRVAARAPGLRERHADRRRGQRRRHRRRRAGVVRAGSIRRPRSWR